MNASLPELRRPMQEQVAARLCKLLDCRQEEDLPADVHDAYAQLSHVATTCGFSKGTDAFFYTLVSMFTETTIPVPGPSFMDYVTNGLVNAGDAVLVKFKAGEWSDATYLKTKRGNVFVQIDGIEREVDPSLVAFDEDAVPA